MRVPTAEGKPLVLVVDDEDHITEMVAMGLGFSGFEVVREASGRAALAAIESDARTWSCST
jgi:DNA-binding response OmpR family regulator